MITRASDIVPQELIDELLRLGKGWVEMDWKSPTDFSANLLKSTYLKAACKTGNDASSMAAIATWLADGPKMFRPTGEQCDVLSQIEVRLPIEDYAQPYPALFVELPAGVFAPFTGVLVYLHEGFVVTGRRVPNRIGRALIGSLFSEGHRNDIVTVVAAGGRPMEEALGKFDHECQDLASVAQRAMRVAVNSCLALANYGCHKDLLLKKQAENDRHLAREKSKRGERAKRRLTTMLFEVKFDREIKLHENRERGESGELTGREVSSHWRRGHWRMQAHGPHGTLRKRILVRPVLVRADKFVGELSETSATYHS